MVFVVCDVFVCMKTRFYCVRGVVQNQLYIF